MNLIYFKPERKKLKRGREGDAGMPNKNYVIHIRKSKNQNDIRNLKIGMYDALCKYYAYLKRKCFFSAFLKL